MVEGTRRGRGMRHRKKSIIVRDCLHLQKMTVDTIGFGRSSVQPMGGMREDHWQFSAIHLEDSCDEILVVHDSGPAGRHFSLCRIWLCAPAMADRIRARHLEISRISANHQPE